MQKKKGAIYIIELMIILVCFLRYINIDDHKMILQIVPMCKMLTIVADHLTDSRSFLSIIDLRVLWNLDQIEHNLDQLTITYS